MKRADLDFAYPEKLVATEPKRPSRVMWVEGQMPEEISLSELLTRIPVGDALVINETRVLPRRVFAGEVEILFLEEVQSNQWQVLFPSREFRRGHAFALPGGVTMTLLEKGRPQLVAVSQTLSNEYFHEHGELPLPPYIQKSRGVRHNEKQDRDWYQTAWSAVDGSLAAPTASLHFSEDDIKALKARGVFVEKLVLHVGLGTFLPLTADNLEDHQMHSEFVEVPRSTWAKLDEVRRQGGKVWALGTTVARSLESVARGLLRETPQGFRGDTALFLYPGAEWKVVDRLMTNFHQPQSTLLALVASFCDLETVKKAYAWAIEREFRLFSYGDLSVWKR